MHNSIAVIRMHTQKKVTYAYIINDQLYLNIHLLFPFASVAQLKLKYKDDIH